MYITQKMFLTLWTPCYVSRLGQLACSNTAVRTAFLQPQ